MLNERDSLKQENEQLFVAIEDECKAHEATKITLDKAEQTITSLTTNFSNLQQKMKEAESLVDESRVAIDFLSNEKDALTSKISAQEQEMVTLRNTMVQQAEQVAS